MLPHQIITPFSPKEIIVANERKREIEKEYHIPRNTQTELGLERESRGKRKLDTTAPGPNGGS